jgi:hypothetical protein
MYVALPFLKKKLNRAPQVLVATGRGLVLGQQLWPCPWMLYMAWAPWLGKITKYSQFCMLFVVADMNPFAAVVICSWTKIAPIYPIYLGFLWANPLHLVNMVMRLHSHSI